LKFIGLLTEVRHVNDERVALPVTEGVAEPPADSTRQVQAAVYDNAALPAPALPDIVGRCDAATLL
jgi:hypothetical protein